MGIEQEQSAVGGRGIQTGLISGYFLAIFAGNFATFAVKSLSR
jgi:hypothetical protein